MKRHTGARIEDRTIIDVLIPFAETYEQSKSFATAVKAAEAAAEGTRQLKAKFGKASYVGAGEGQDLPDLGAWALMEIVKGMGEVINTLD